VFCFFKLICAALLFLAAAGTKNEWALDVAHVALAVNRKNHASHASDNEDPNLCMMALAGAACEARRIDEDLGQDALT
jgi:hypothetical protein